MAYYLVNRLDNPALLPKDYIHTFILRNPKKSVYSLYKMSLNKELTGKYNYEYMSIFECVIIAFICNMYHCTLISLCKKILIGFAFCTVQVSNFLSFQCVN